MYVISIIQHLLKSIILYRLALVITNNQGYDKKKSIINQSVLVLISLLLNVLRWEFKDSVLLSLDIVVVLLALSMVVKNIIIKSYSLSIAIAMVTYAVYSIYLVATSVIIYPICYLMGLVNYLDHALVMFFVISILFIYRVKLRIDIQINNILEKKYAQWFIICCGMLVLFATRGLVIISRYIEINAISMLFYAFTCICLIMIVLWIIDKIDQYKEKQAVLADNRKMDSKLHRQKELVPSIEFYLGDLIQELEDGKDPTDALRKVKVLRQELGQIYGEQRIESRRDVMIGQFTSTGLQLLDGQLNRYMLEAVKENIDFDVMVSASIDESLEKYEIKHSDVHVLVGDLVRNAFRAVERKDDDSSKIFFCSGYIAPGDYEIDVYDDGEEFPLEVLKNFGIRGVTTGGTGNGLADVLETLAQYKASLRLEEFRPLSNEHTKGLSIVFDGMGEISIESYRYQLLESIGLPDNVLLIAPVDEKL